MAGTVTLTANGGTMEEFCRAMDRFRKEVGNSNTVACRRGVIYLLQSLRARTARSKEYVPKRAVTRAPKGKGHWIRNRKTGIAQRRWLIERRGGADRYIASTLADNAAQARMRGGRLRNRGLARLAWGKLMQLMFKQTSKSDFKGTEPADFVGGHFHSTEGDLARPKVDVLLWDKLAYASESLKGTLDGALIAAKNRIVHLIKNRLVKARDKELGK